MKYANTFPMRESLQEEEHISEDFWQLAKTYSYRLFLIVLEIQLLNCDWHCCQELGMIDDQGPQEAKKNCHSSSS